MGFGMGPVELQPRVLRMERALGSLWDHLSHPLRSIRPEFALLTRDASEFLMGRVHGAVNGIFRDGETRVVATQNVQELASRATAFAIRTIDMSRSEELDEVARNTLRSHQETIPETRGRTDLQNMTFESMRDMLANAFQKPDRHCLIVLNAAGQVIGHRILKIKVDAHGDRFGEGWNLFIDPDYRKLGIASQLMLEADAWFRAQGVKYLETGTHVDNVKMQNLYAKQGYHFERFDHNGTNPVYIVRKYF